MLQFGVLGPDFQQQIAEVSQLEDPTLFNAMMEGHKKAAATLPAVTPPPSKRQKAKTAAGAIEIPDTPPPSALRHAPSTRRPSGLTTEQPHD